MSIEEGRARFLARLAQDDAGEAEEREKANALNRLFRDVVAELKATLPEGSNYYKDSSEFIFGYASKSLRLSIQTIGGERCVGLDGHKVESVEVLYDVIEKVGTEKPKEVKVRTTVCDAAVLTTSDGLIKYIEAGWEFVAVLGAGSYLLRHGASRCGCGGEA